MSLVILENGLKINFSGTPTPQDVDHVVSTIHKEKASNSFLQGIVDKYFTAKINYGDSAPAKPEPPVYELPTRGVKLTDDDLDTLNHVLMGEVGNRDSNKTKLETQTIVNTALNRLKAYSDRGEKVSLSDVLKMPNQYQGYMPDGVKKPDGTTTPSQYQLAQSGQLDPLSKVKLDDIKSVTGQLKTGDFPDTTNGAYYYQHDPVTKEIHYDDTKPLFSK